MRRVREAHRVPGSQTVCRWTVPRSAKETRPEISPEIGPELSRYAATISPSEQQK